MSQFKVKPDKVKEVATGEKECANELGRKADEVEQICNSLSFKVSSSANIRHRIQNASRAISRESSQMKKMSRQLTTIADCYERTENKICGAAKDGEISSKETLEYYFEKLNEKTTGFLIGNIPFVGPAVCVLDFILSSDKEISYPSGKLRKFNDGLDDKLEDLEDAIKSKLHIPEKKEAKRQGYWENGRFHEIDQSDENAKKKFESEKLDKAATIFKAEAKKEASLYSKEGEVKGKYGELSGEIKAGNAEAHANCYGGIYSTGPDGAKKFTPGVGGEIGVGVTAFTAEGMALLGNDNIGAYIKGDVTAGKAEAKVGGDLGFFKDGKFNPQANIEASAEAILIEGTAAVGAKVLGTDVSGNVGVNVGVGAHANVGIKDGKINLDVGASLGVGVSVNLEIDFSGTIDKVGTAVSECTSFIGNLFK